MMLPVAMVEEIRTNGKKVSPEIIKELLDGLSDVEADQILMKPASQRILKGKAC